MILLLAVAGTQAWAQGFPEKGKLVRIVVPTGAGSALDLLARAYAKAITDATGAGTLVENKPGADGVIGIQYYLSLPADGHSLLLLSSSFTVLNPVINPRIAYDAQKDLQPLATISKAGLVMSMGSGAPFKSLREFTASARANPGKHTCAVSTATLIMACEYLQATAGIKLLIVPYKTTAAAMVAVASGESDVIFADAGSFVGLWQSGRLKPAAFTTTERVALFPNVPTTREEGLPDFLMGAWYGLYTKGGTPAALASAAREELRKLAGHEAIKGALKTFVHEPLDLGIDEITAMTRQETDQWNRLVRDRGIKFNQ